MSCSRQKVESGHQARELIPAEWTVAEDTSVTGDVTTVSLQLPAAKDISGLLETEEPRLVLRCMDGRVEGFIDIEQPVSIQLDSAPACE
jgi:hypothetical protein